ncbi:unnamed protein product [Cyclocybe aegerita]|uniref:Aldehyde dehydrogenase domain-containing protein n=1 Tax=Cyclocybe aegerita TaxID=1973307 RepID=A0A8S0VU87_CYCAE|nr:unnamed protein product [Cyclocybe aegerita]
MELPAHPRLPTPLRCDRRWVIKPSEISAHFSLLTTLLPHYLDFPRCALGLSSFLGPSLPFRLAPPLPTPSPPLALALRSSSPLLPLLLLSALPLLPFLQLLPSPIPTHLNHPPSPTPSPLAHSHPPHNNNKKTVDHIFYTTSAHVARLISHRKHLESLFPGGALGSKDYGRIVSDSHPTRLQVLLEHTAGRGSYSRREVGSDVLLEDELFGPVLPVVEVEGLEGALEYLEDNAFGDREHPLAVYAFTNDEEVKKTLESRTTSGTPVFGDTFAQVAINELPFGGVGESGYGRQALKYSFENFVYERGVVDVPFGLGAGFFAFGRPLLGSRSSFGMGADKDEDVIALSLRFEDYVAGSSFWIGFQISIPVFAALFPGPTKPPRSPLVVWSLFVVDNRWNCVEELEGALEYLEDKEHPLVSHAFTDGPDNRKTLESLTTSGKFVFSGTFTQVAINELPFGGVRESGAFCWLAPPPPSSSRPSVSRVRQLQAEGGKRGEEKEHPSVMYGFTDADEIKKKLDSHTTSGTIVFGNAFEQVAINERPFGGVGESGYRRQVLKGSFGNFAPGRGVDVAFGNEPYDTILYLPQTLESLEFMSVPLKGDIPRDKPLGLS